jgi:hypothetical protein
MRVRWWLAMGSGFLAIALLPMVAGAVPEDVKGPQAQSRPYKVKDLRVVSGPSPFAAGCPGAQSDDTNITGHELEPAITVNPDNPRNIIAAWKQDVGPDSSRSDLVGSSLDGGKTWSRSTIPGLTICTGGTADAGSDPWVSAGGDGIVYFSGLAADISTDPPTTAVLASHSTDGGRSWPAPATVAPPLQGNETESITGSPTIAGRAYAVWADFGMGNLKYARTTDGGITWSSPVVVDQPGPAAVDVAPRLLVLPDGALLTVFARADFESGLGELHAARSLDDGQTWLPAVQFASKPIETFFDPEGEALPQPQFPSAAVAPDGTVYVAIEANNSATSGVIGVARSRDGGVTWQSAPLPGVSAYAFEPAIAVDKHGTVGIIWYDLRNDRPGDAALTADVWFAHSDNRGSSWRQTHVAGPTDLRTAPLPAHNYVGEYQGLAALRGRSFAAIFTLAAPQAKDGPTDIFFARIGPG